MNINTRLLSFRCCDEVNVVIGLEWQMYYTDDGYPYWYNLKTKESTWENPFEVKVAPEVLSSEFQYEV
jgi:hypothetical protein